MDKQAIGRDLRELDVAVGEIEVETRDHALDMANRLKALRDRLADIADGLKEDQQPKG